MKSISNKIRKSYFIVFAIFVLIIQGYNTSDARNNSRQIESSQEPYYLASEKHEYQNVSRKITLAIKSPGIKQREADIEACKKDLKLKFDKNIENTLKMVLSNYYKGSEFVIQQRAFARVIKWKKDIEDIAKKYNNVDWKKLCAIAKAETEGKTGNQVSSAMAIGMTQIKYQGAWAFFWDMVFSKRVRHGSRYVKDYYNENLRARYSSQLDQAIRYLEENSIIVYPKSVSRSDKGYKRARFQSWKKRSMI